MSIQEKIRTLQNLMKERKMDLYLVPTADFHQSEYVGEYFKERAYLTGFTGSVGTVVISAAEAALWVDGRYFVQAENQLQGSGIRLMKMGQEGVSTLEEYIAENLPQRGCLGFDGRVMSAKLGKTLEQIVCKKEGHIACQEDVVNLMWEGRPSISKEPAYFLDSKYTGVTKEEKIAQLRVDMEKMGASVHILASLEDIAWLLNIRGNDIAYNTVVLSYALVTLQEFYLFIQEEALSLSMKESLEADGITICPYEAIYQKAALLEEQEVVLLHEEDMNYALLQAVPSACKIIDAANPTTLAKAKKTKTEIENERIAHKKDAVAICRFLYWLKHEVGKSRITELSAAAHSLELRKLDPDFLDLSFSTIAAYGDNAAMCHYSPTPETDKEVEAKGFFLLDSGAQYWQGTTDITRTVAVGPLTQEEKETFTLVLQGHIRLARAKFLHGCCGANLDILAREPLWERGLDFNHGTGHGVGYLSNVHEGPNNIRWRMNSMPNGGAVLEEGMLTSNEPGFYAQGKYGIRTENLLVCHEGKKTEFGQFMEFETITLAPIDREAIVVSMLKEEERDWLNAYHKRVYETVAPLLPQEEALWLKEVTAEV